MKFHKRTILSILTLMVFTVSAAGCKSEGITESTSSVTGEAASEILQEQPKEDGVYTISFDEDSATLDGEKIKEYDYTWHCDPSEVHDDVEDAPAEYYTGQKGEGDVYIDHELYYYPKLSETGFKKVNYDGEEEWAYYYEDGENNDYIFSTLPVLGGSVPSEMMHSEEEASENKVLHITKAGKYILEGEWKGQVWVDLDDAEDSDAKVELVLNNVNIECSVAPGIVYKNVYECDSSWEDRDEYSADVDTTDAGAIITIADGSDNTVTGTNIYRMLKTVYKDDESTDEIKTQKKLRKIDGALYSYMTMNVNAQENETGKLTVNSGFEGIDSELHLSVNGGNITINADNDGMNVNEDHVSVISLYGGELTINPGQGQEGDGIDSNGYIKIDGGILRVNGVRAPDSALDSDDGTYYESGEIYIDDELQSYEAGSVIKEDGFGGALGGDAGTPDGRPDGPGGNTPPDLPDNNNEGNGQPPQPPENNMI